MNWRIDLTIILSVFILSSCVPEQANKKQKQDSNSNGIQGNSVSKNQNNQGNQNDQGEDDDDDNDSDKNKKDTTPTPEPTKTIVKDMAVRGTSMCVALSGGLVKCAGENGYGEFGSSLSYYSTLGEINDYYTLHLGTDFEIAQLKGGIGSFYCALSTTGAVKCWGFNFHGNLGQGVPNDTYYVDLISHPPYSPTNIDIGADKAVQISAGGYHVCIVTNKGDVKCWGENSESQLGLGHQSNIGDGPNEMGANLKTVNLGTNLKAIKVAAGWRFTCALLSNHQVKCWGFDFNGALGDDAAHTQENDNRFQIGARASDMGDNLAPVYLGENAIDISAGADHVCAILASGKVKCWGDNSYSQLGLADNENRGAYSSTHSMHDLPTLNFGGLKAKKISAIGRGTCAILENGETICWGRNDYAALGIGSVTANTSFYTIPYATPSVKLSDSRYINFGTGLKADRIFNGEIYSCALLTNGKVKCWGASANIVKGTGGYIGDVSSEMGDNLGYLNLGI